MPTLQNNKNKTPFSYVSVLFLYVTSGLFFLFLGLAFILKLPLLSLLAQIKESYFFLYRWDKFVGDIEGTNFQVHVYAAIAFLSFFMLIKERFFSYHKKTAFSLRKHCRLIPHITLIVLFWLVSLQTFNQTQFLAKQIRLLAGKSTQEKQSLMFGQVPDFTRYGQELLPGRHRCEFQTDKDISRDPFMFRHRQLAYFLYPAIDIRGVHPERPVDCLILWQKNAAQHVPDNFKIKGVFNFELVIAVKKETP